MSKTAAPYAAQARLTADEFVLWAMEQPESERYELAGGKVVAMAPERLSHALVLAHDWQALDQAV